MPKKFTASAVLVAVAVAAGAVGCGSASAGAAAGAAQSSSAQPTEAPSGSAPASTPAKPIPTPSRSYGPPSHVPVTPGAPGPKFPAAIASGADAEPVGGSIEIFRNGWGTADGKTTVLVSAGASRADPSDGLFVIVRQTQAGGQSQNNVTVAGSGAVWISSAPLGAGVETSAQTGDLSFDSDSGMTGVLHLSDDTVTITGNGTATPTATQS